MMCLPKHPDRWLIPIPPDQAHQKESAMSQSVPVSAPPRSQPAPWVWMSVALLAHTGWGAYPVLARYLQTISHLPSMAILAVGNLISLAVLIPLARHKLNPEALRSKALWLFALIVVIRAITNLLAARYTSAIIVQLITLMTPLFVAVLSTTIFRERLPSGTIWALGLSLLGSIFIVSNDLGGGVGHRLTTNDFIGMGTAFTSALCLAMYMILIPRTVKGPVSGEALLAMQLTALTITTGIISLITREDWSRFTVIGLFDWVVFFAFVFGVLFGANMGQNLALRHLGAPLVSSMMAWRLVCTLIMAALLLDERLQTPLQFLGALIVIVTITVYLWRQRPPEKTHKKA